VTWWGVFVTVVLVVLGLVLVVAGLMDRHARAHGYRLDPDLARRLRRHRGDLREVQARDVLGYRRPPDRGSR
jgi:hypothetical protein